jgi:hypothetical protein
MAIDPLANIVERLRSSGFQPLMVGPDAWESRCPGHASKDHALLLKRGRDGRLILQCRGTQNCSFSSILKKLNLKLRHLNRDTNESVIRRMRKMEVQLGLYKQLVPVVADPVVLTMAATAAVADAPALGQAVDIAAAALVLPSPESDENTTPSSESEAETEKPDLPPRSDVPIAHGEAIDDLSGSAQECSHEIALAEAAADSTPARSSADSLSTTDSDTDKKRANEILLQIAAGARPFRRPDGQYSVSIAVSGHQECHALESPEVVRWLTRRFYESTRRLPSSASLAATIRALATRADFAGTAEADFVRVGCDKSGSTIWLDLGDSTWRAVEIHANGWQVVDRPNVHFRRATGQCALPIPARDGSIAILRKYVNVEPADLPLLIGWLTAALRPTGPHPILVITGEQGSAKSTLARICRLLVDPHNTPLRAEPKDNRDLMVAALHGWVQAYDNLSAMPDWLSNGLCRLVTGGGISTRGLFTNHEEVVWSAHRPVILTSIDDIVQRPDVIDRSIFLQLRSIAPSSRRCEEDLWEEFMADYPRILGALLDAVVAGIRLRPAVRLAELERMADFTRWGEAVAQGAGWAPGTFVKAYRANRQAVNSVMLEDSSLAQALLSLAKYHGPWKGTLTQLLELIAGYTGYCSLTTPGWPKTPAIASAELRRIAPQLRMFGLSVTFERSSRAGRIVTFTPTHSSGTARAHVG